MCSTHLSLTEIAQYHHDGLILVVSTKVGCSALFQSSTSSRCSWRRESVVTLDQRIQKGDEEASCGWGRAVGTWSAFGGGRDEEAVFDIKLTCSSD